MAPLHNTKHELFAQGLAEGKSMTEAYRAAGYKPNRSHASRLVAKGNIKGRVAELQDAAAAKTQITIESLIKEAADIQKRATKAGQHSAARSFSSESEARRSVDGTCRAAKYERELRCIRSANDRRRVGREVRY